MWREDFHYHEFIVSGQVQGSIKVHRNNYEISVNGKTKFLSDKEKLSELKSYVEKTFAKPY